MKTLSSILLISILLVSCKTDPKPSEQTIVTEKELSAADKIAEAHGFKNWSRVKELAFTFNVDKDSTHFERAYIWNTKTNEVTAMTVNDAITYQRKQVDSLSLRADQGFINDKFWLLPAFQLVWDSGTTISKPVKEQAPISNDSLNKITLSYSNNGGYTPGDAYDFYYDENYYIKEWIFRKGNSKEPSIITAFSDYKTIEGLSFPTKSKKKDNNWSLYFTDIKVKTE
jgi:hypothetical protein